MPRVGDLIGGKYRLDELVGSGGMGLVYAATHVSIAQSVALKFVRHDPKTDGTATVRLLREARVVGGLKSEHVARVHDVGQLEDGAPYLVMELLEGSTLDAVVRAEGALTVEDACECLIQACHALGEAHSLGIVHRDVKPSNLFRTLDSAGQMRLKVIDFGISRARLGTEAGEAHPTQTGAFLGSPPFMSPEQILEAKDVDARSDVWSLGVVLYFLLAGRLPFEAPSLLELMTKIAYEEPSPLTGARGEIPAELAAIVARCVRKDRQERFATAGELADALVPHAHDRARSVARRIARDVAAPSVAPPVAPDTAPTDDDAVSRTRSIGAAAAPAELLDADPTLAEPARSRPRTARATVLAVAVLMAIGSVSAVALFAVGRTHGGPVVIATASATATEVPSTATSATSTPAVTPVAEVASGATPPLASAGTAPPPKSAPRPGPGTSRPRSNHARADSPGTPGAPARAVASVPPGRPSLPTTPD